MNKYLIHVKTGDFEFIETEVEGGVEDALMEHKRLTTAILEPNTGLPTKEWNQALDYYMIHGSLESSDIHERMSPGQVRMIHELDKSAARINRESK